MSVQEHKPGKEPGITAYRKGCRCELCRKANTEYHREYQKRVRKGTAPVFDKIGDAQ